MGNSRGRASRGRQPPEGTSFTATPLRGLTPPARLLSGHHPAAPGSPPPSRLVPPGGPRYIPALMSQAADNPVPARADRLWVLALPALLAWQAWMTLGLFGCRDEPGR